MKNYFKHTIALLFVSSFAFTSCLDLTSNATDAEASLQETLDRSRNAELPLMACEYDDRKTTGIVTDKVGVIKQMQNATDTESALFLIFIDDESVRYTACNLPESVMKDGMQITFSGEEKEIMAHEKWVARPIKLTNIREISGGDPKDDAIQTASLE